MFLGPDKNLDFPQDYSHFKEIFLNIRLPKLITILLAGGGLAVAGLIMQVWFQNPLVGPYILGVQSGAQLAITLWVVFMSSFQLSFLKFSSIGVSVAGALSILFLVSFLGHKLGDDLILILVGILIGSFCSGVATGIMSFVDSPTLRSLLTWNLGSFSNVANDQLLLFSSLLLILLAAIFPIYKKLEIMQMGPDYASSMGLDIKGLRLKVFLIVGILAGVITAYCGPLVFLGVIAPHFSRWLIRSSRLKHLLPLTFMVGATLGMFAQVIQTLSSPYFWAINSTLNFISGPILLFLVVKKFRYLRVGV